MPYVLRRAARLATLALVSGALIGCSGGNVPTDDPAAEECTTGHQRACYGGAEGTAGVGKCRKGVQECIAGKWSPLCKDEVLPVTETCDGQDNDCDGSVDEGVDNACGGCVQLPASPGTSCAGCGTWRCDGPDRLVCEAPQQAVGDNCQKDGCSGVYACGTGGVICNAPAKNACGVCGGPQVSGVGEACTTTEGCTGKLECKGEGTLFCKATANVNACGKCNGPVIDNLGQACPAADDCTGNYVCNAAGDGVVCAGGKNQCGVCSANPVVLGLGDPCTASDGCTGTRVCSPSGLGTVCEATEAANECGVCGGPPVFYVGSVCMSAAGCLGELVCNPAGDAAVCNAPTTCTVQKALVKISEISPGGPSASNTTWNTDEFVELYNPTNSVQNLTDHALWYRSGGGQYRKMINFPAGTMIQPKGFLLLGKAAGANSTGYVGPPAADLTYSSGADIGAQGHVFLTANTSIEPESATDPHVVDMVGYGGSATIFEGSAAALAVPSVPAGSATAGSIERKAFVTSTTATMEGGADAAKGNGYDSNDNSQDFVIRTVRQPQSSLSQTEQ